MFSRVIERGQWHEMGEKRNWLKKETSGFKATLRTLDDFKNNQKSV